MSTLYVFSGLPGAGKSTLAKKLAQVLGAVYLRVDTVEQAIKDLCKVQVYSEGYELSYAFAMDNLKIGQSVVADSCNPVQITRDAWIDTASKAGAGCVNVEIICSDRAEHKRRLEQRVIEVEGLKRTSWKSVENREYESWSMPILTVDTAKKTVEESLDELLKAVGQKAKVAHP